MAARVTGGAGGGGGGGGEHLHFITSKGRTERREGIECVPGGNSEQ